MSNTTTNQKPHRYSHLPIPTEQEMDKILLIMEEYKNNPKLSAMIKEMTPPHIMEALLSHVASKADMVEHKVDLADQVPEENEQFISESLLFKKSVNKKIKQKA